MKDYLYEVIPIRLFLIVLLVFYHAFCIFSGAWSPILGYPEIPLYSILDKLSYACLLETFVFISGYILGYQVKKKGVLALSAKSIFLKKFNRLIIPSILFSFLYILLFGNIKQPILQTLYSIINGVGHMWFLPMLFWCFVGVYILEKLQIKYKIAIGLLFCMMFFSIIPLPLRIGSSFYYLFFFYVGYLLQKYNYKIVDNKYSFTLFLFLFFVVFILKMQLPRFNGEEITLLTIFIYASSRLIRVLCASLGIFILFFLSTRIIKQVTINWKELLYLSDCCFGVYLFQQFILLFIYQSEFPLIFNPYVLPWFSFVLSLIISILLTIILRKTKAGRLIL